MNACRRSSHRHALARLASASATAVASGSPGSAQLRLDGADPMRRPAMNQLIMIFPELKLTEIVCSPRIAGSPNCNLYLMASIGELPIFNNVCSMKLFAQLRSVP
jgi:hypothetical protein